MAKLTFKAGVTSQTIDIFIQDSSSTIGAGLSGLVFNTSGLKAYYRKGATGTATSISIITQTVGGAWSSGGFVEIDATNMKGVYRFDVPDTVFASSPSAILYFYGATNMAPVVAEVEIVAYDPFDSVRLGLTALPNAAAGAVGGLPLSVDTSGRVDVLKINGTSQTARDIGASVLLSAGTGVGQLDFTSGVVKANLVQILGTALTETAGQIAAGFKKFFNVAAPVMDVTSVNQTGDSFARIGTAGVSLTNLGDTRIVNLDATVSSRLASASYTAPDNADIVAIKAKTDNLPANPAATSDIPTTNANADALLDRVSGVETNMTPRQTLRLMSAVLFGKSSGHPGSPIYRDVNDTTNRVTATVSAGNRSSVTLAP